jgi:hypothetical protein
VALTATIIHKLPQQRLLPAHQVHQQSSAATATLINNNNKNRNNQPDDLTLKTPTKRALPLPMLPLRCRRPSPQPSSLNCRNDDRLIAEYVDYKRKKGEEIRNKVKNKSNNDRKYSRTYFGYGGRCGVG